MTPSKWRVTVALMPPVIIAVHQLLQGNPWLVAYPNDSQMVLSFTRFVSMPTGPDLLFFQQGSVFTYAPASFILSKIYYLLVPSPIITEFVLPSLISSLLLSVLTLKALNTIKGPFMPFVVYSIELLILSDSTKIDFLWFPTAGYWILLVLIIVLFNARASNNRAVFPFVLLVLMIQLSDVGPPTYAILILLLPLAQATRGVFTRFFTLTLLIFFAYASAVNFVTLTYNLSYVRYVYAQITSLLTLSVSAFTQHLSSVGLPLWQLIGDATGFVLLFAVVPLFLLINGLPTPQRRSLFLIPGLILAFAAAMRVGNVLLPVPVYVSAIYGFMLYLFLPCSILGVTATLRNGKARVPRFRGRISNTMLMFGLVGVILISVLSTTPVFPVGGIHTVSDPRVQFAFLQVGYVYANHYGSSAVLGQQFSDLANLFSGPLSANPRFYLVSDLPSPYQVVSLANQPIYYSNGAMYIIPLT